VAARLPHAFGTIVNDDPTTTKGVDPDTVMVRLMMPRFQQYAEGLPPTLTWKRCVNYPILPFKQSQVTVLTNPKAL
jgi:hypothetical protein